MNAITYKYTFSGDYIKIVTPQGTISFLGTDVDALTGHEHTIPDRPPSTPSLSTSLRYSVP